MRFYLPRFLRIAGLELELAHKLRYELINLNHSDVLSDTDPWTHPELAVVVGSVKKTTRIAKQNSKRI